MNVKAQYSNLIGVWLSGTSQVSGPIPTTMHTKSYVVWNKIPELEDGGKNNSSHVKTVFFCFVLFCFLKLTKCLPKCSSPPKERHCCDTNERS
uniref:Uncharacterized protein n=1 Tax=Spermophilus dauricus TaxID=99837 RepID=A0A8C9USF9_SPEDA